MSHSVSDRVGETEMSVTRFGRCETSASGIALKISHSMNSVALRSSHLRYRVGIDQKNNKKVVVVSIE